MRLFVVTCSNQVSFTHYKKTIESTVPLSVLKNYLTKTQSSELKKNIKNPKNSVAMWGFSTQRGEGLWKDMVNGDVVYIYRKKEHFLRGRIAYKVKNISLAKKDWSLDEKGRPYKYIFFIDDISKISITQKQFNKAANFSPNYPYLGGAKRDYPESMNVLKALHGNWYKQQTKKSVKKKTGKPRKSKSQINVYARRQDVIDYVKQEANGKCDLCFKSAPFKNKYGAPYLECHHIKRLADNGDDDYHNAVALCPNCHRKIHSLNLKSDINKLKNRVASRDKNL
jgi:predicted HNH restriction endonuclease